MHKGASVVFHLKPQHPVDPEDEDHAKTSKNVYSKRKY